MKHDVLANLVLRAREGDEQAFAQLYAHFAHTVYYSALRIVGNSEDANDVVQETIMKLYTSLYSLKDPKSVTKYVNTTAYHASISLLRKRNEDLSFDAISAENFMAEDQVDFLPQSYLEKKEGREAVIKALDSLHPNHRIVLLQYYFQEQSIGEIAETLDVSDQAVKNRLFRARESLKSVLSNHAAKGVFMSGVSYSVLSKVLAIDAEASFSPTLHAANWQALGQKMGFSPEAISKYSELASTPSSQAPSTNAPQPKPKKPPSLTTKLLSGLAAGTVVTLGAIGLYRSAKPLPPLPAPPPALIEARELPDLSEPDSALPPGLEVPPSKDPTPPPPVEIPPSLDAPEAPEPIPQQLPPLPPVAAPWISLQNLSPLRYQKGTGLTPEQIVGDAQVVSTQPGEFQVLFFDQIDTSTSGQYGVLVEQTTQGDATSNQVSVIVIIE